MNEHNVEWEPRDGARIRDWLLSSKIGHGSYGAVYAAKNQFTHQCSAIKFEDRTLDEQKRRLKLEVNVINELIKRKARFCVTFLDYGRVGQYNYMVMPLLGKNLQELAKMVQAARVNPDGLFSPPTVLHIAKGSLSAIKELHRCHFIHRDIKPENFAMSPNGEDVYLLDFGTARKYAHFFGEHYRARAVAAFRGTYAYASPNALRENEQSRRDDVWSWLFMLIMFSNGHLPWSTTHVPKAQSVKEMLNLYADEKEVAIRNPSVLLANCPSCFRIILDRISTYNHYKQPEYDLFQQALDEEKERFRLQRMKMDLDWRKRKYIKYVESLGQ